jgi:hypothetical protein
MSACATQYGVEQSVFGESMSGVQSRDDCENLPEVLRAGCEFRFDWMNNQVFPTYACTIPLSA